MVPEVTIGMLLYSLERRRERYQVIYIWKILEGHCPNISHAVTSDMSLRHGSKCVLPHNRDLSRKLTSVREANTRCKVFPSCVQNLSAISVSQFKKYTVPVYQSEVCPRGFDRVT